MKTPSDHRRVATRRIACALRAGLTAGVWLLAARAWADGGTLQGAVEQDGLQMAIFTTPATLRVGPVDVSVLAQDAAGSPLTDAEIVMRWTSAGGSAATVQETAARGHATNQLLQSAVSVLPAAGDWELEVVCRRGGHVCRARYLLAVAPPLPRWLEIWPWVSWPPAVAAAFALSRILRAARQKAARGKENPL